MKDTAILWQPDQAFQESSNMKAYMSWLKTQRNLVFQDYESLWQWSVDETDVFWKSIWDYFQIQCDGLCNAIVELPESGMLGTKWFEGTYVNYAEHILRNANDEFPAIVFKSERNELIEISWQQLHEQVERVAAFLHSKGVGVGDRVVSYMPNIPEALVAFLATNAIGAIWSSTSPDFGLQSVVDRFQQIQPKVIFLVDGYAYNGKGYDKTEVAKEIVAGLPSVEHVVLLPYLNKTAKLDLTLPLTLWGEILELKSTPLKFVRAPFSHPIWVLYSSGTTGKPKAITHSVGGVLVEHYKALLLHQDTKLGERFFWYSTTGWMMWNYANAALLAGSTLVIYDGSASYPDLNVLWNLAEEAQITHFGGGAAFYIASMKQGISFSNSPGKVKSIRSIGSTGSPLPSEAFRWVYEHVKSDLWLISLSGGTDVCSGFVGGSPLLPVHEGEIQTRMLGSSIEAYNESGEPVIGELGEMILSKPMPSMPIYFWGDKDNKRYRESYFEMYPDVWRHGDWIKITEKGTVIIYGRSDATLNRGGVRIGTSEVYQAVESIPEVLDSLVLSIEKEGGTYYMPLYVVLAEGIELDSDMIKKIKTQLRTQFSPRHVPDEIMAIPAVPYTISGKKMETPVKKILMGMDPGKAISKDAMRNPEALEFFMTK